MTSLLRALLEMQLQSCPEWTKDKSSKFYEISSSLIKIRPMPKILFVDTVYMVTNADDDEIDASYIVKQHTQLL